MDERLHLEASPGKMRLARELRLAWVDYPQDHHIMGSADDQQLLQVRLFHLACNRVISKPYDQVASLRTFNRPPICPT